MDIIFLRELKIDTIVGIYEWERRMPQTVIFDLEMGTDIAKAAASDNIDDTLNYKAVAKRIIGFVGDSEFQLVDPNRVRRRMAETDPEQGRRSAWITRCWHYHRARHANLNEYRSPD